MESRIQREISTDSVEEKRREEKGIGSLPLEVLG